MNVANVIRVFGATSLMLALLAGRVSAKSDYLSPIALLPDAEGKLLYVACHTANEVRVFEVASSKVLRSIPMPASPTSLALSKDGTRLYVACADVNSSVAVVDTRTGKITATLPAGHTAMNVCLSPDEKTLYVCNRFNNEVAVINLADKTVKARIPLPREPIAAAITPDGQTLFVANHLHDGTANGEVVAAKVSVIDTAANQVATQLTLPNGSGLLLDMKVSPDGRYAAVTHLLSRFHLPTTQLERGWMNTDALTLIDAKTRKIINTILLDNVDSGAANPWGIAWTADSQTMCVAHAGTHELSVIDIKGLLEKLAKMPTSMTNFQTVDYTAASRIASDIPNDLSFLVSLRQRVRYQTEYGVRDVNKGDLGPRGVAIIGKKAFTANYFSDTLTLVDFDTKYIKPVSLSLGTRKAMSIVRKGEFYFNDASICFQGWQSCGSCHSFDARVDALNWDLLNDGIGNPKNTKSMILSHKTPPAMSQGVRETAESAVRAGIRHILFTVQPEEVPASMDEYLKSLKPTPSPHLVNGKLSPSAQRGQKLFNSPKAACAACHPADKLFTTLNHYDVGTKGEYDNVAEFDTPTLHEVWRTAPYLHDGSAATIKDLLTKHNKGDKHGHTSGLTPQEIDDLAAYVLSQ
ncbi:MAG: c-type cytochrome [Verrucomicrobiota bacterium]